MTLPGCCCHSWCCDTDSDAGTDTDTGTGAVTGTGTDTVAEGCRPDGWPIHSCKLNSVDHESVSLRVARALPEPRRGPFRVRGLGSSRGFVRRRFLFGGGRPGIRRWGPVDDDLLGRWLMLGSGRVAVSLFPLLGRAGYSESTCDPKKGRLLAGNKDKFVNRRQSGQDQTRTRPGELGRHERRRDENRAGRQAGRQVDRQ